MKLYEIIFLWFRHGAVVHRRAEDHSQLKWGVYTIIEGGFQFPLHCLLREILNHYTAHPNDLMWHSVTQMTPCVSLFPHNKLQKLCPHSREKGFDCKQMASRVRLQVIGFFFAPKDDNW